MHPSAQYLREIPLPRHDSESELLFLDELAVFRYFLTGPEVFQGLLRTGSSWNKLLERRECLQKHH